MKPRPKPHQKLIRDARKEKGMKPAQLARHLDVTPSTVHAWEHGGAGPHAKHLRQIADLLGIDFTKLLLSKAA